MLGVEKPYVVEPAMAVAQDSFEFGSNGDGSSTNSHTSNASSKDLGRLTSGDGAQNFAQDSSANSIDQDSTDNTNSDCSTLNLLAVLSNICKVLEGQ